MSNTPTKKRARYVTPPCVCKWPHLMSPDTKFNNLGVYKVSLLMGDAGAKALYGQVKAEVDEKAAEIRKRSKQAQAWKTAWPIKDDTDDDDNPTGQKRVDFVQQARVVREGMEDLFFDVAVVDAKLKPLPKDAKMGSGSVLKVSFTVRVVEDSLNKCVRVKFQILGAQVIKFVEYSQDLGFGEEDGYEAPADAHANGHATPASEYEGEPETVGATHSDGAPEDSDIPF